MGKVVSFSAFSSLETFLYYFLIWRLSDLVIYIFIVSGVHFSCFCFKGIGSKKFKACAQ